MIPASAFSNRPQTPAAREAFHTLRAALTYFNVDNPRPSIVIASPGKGEGKTTVATQLATACAHGGGDVILVDADLRHPQLASRLEIATGIGIESVLIGKATLEEALIERPLQGPRDGRLRVLAAFDIVPNPAQLLASKRMHELLERLTQLADTVVVDTSPALMVADSFPLFEAASGTLVVARLDRTYKVAVERLQWTIENAHGSVLGTVATGAEERDPYGRFDYAYGSRETSEPNDGDGGAPLEAAPPPPPRRRRFFRRRGRKTGSQPEPSNVGSATGI